MQAIVEINFDELLKVVKNLPEDKLSQLKAEIENKDAPNKMNREEFKTFLLSGPTFSKEQLNEIAKTRKALNKWRTK